MFDYRAKLVRVVDGDTVDLDIDLGFHIHTHERVRLTGINTPELHSPLETERVKAKAAAEFLTTLLGGELVVKTSRDSQEKYGRFLARLYSTSGVCANDEMVKSGHAVAYDGGKR